MGKDLEFDGREDTAGDPSANDDYAPGAPKLPPLEHATSDADLGGQYKRNLQDEDEGAEADPEPEPEPEPEADVVEPKDWDAEDAEVVKAEVESRGLEVTRGDGKEGDPLKADNVAALTADDERIAAEAEAGE